MEFILENARQNLTLEEATKFSNKVEMKDVEYILHYEDKNGKVENKHTISKIMITIDSLEELLSIQDKIEQDLILETPNTSSGYRKIIIYDDYVE